MSQPKISVCIPNHNHGDYVGETIEAVVSQTLAPFEVIVVDDASTDHSADVVSALSERYPAVRLIRNVTNRGALYSVNYALEQASGDFVYLVASDDKPLPGFFERSVAMLQKYPAAGMCAVAIELIDKGGNALDKSQRISHHTHEQHVRLAHPVFLAPNDVLRRLRRQPWFLGGVTSVMFRRATIQEAGGMISDHGPMADWFAPHFVALKYGMCYIPEPLVAFRIVPNSFGTGAASHPQPFLTHAARIIALMQQPDYRAYFPRWFVAAKRREFTYAAFRLSFVTWHRSFLAELAQSAPPTSFFSRLLLRSVDLVMKVQWVLLRSYCYRNVAGALKDTPVVTGRDAR